MGWGDDGFIVTGGRSRQAGWWNKVVGLSHGAGGKEFREKFNLILGNGVKIFFWNHIWVGESSLKSIFPRLFRLSNNQGGYVRSMGKWEGGVWVWSLSWRRVLLDREQQQVDVLMSMLDNVVLVAGSEDRWQWKASPNGEYTTKSAYEVFSSSQPCNLNGVEDKLLKAVWKEAAPFKAKTTAWRILRGRMATCDNLIKRKVEIVDDQAKCVACKRHAETTDHLILHCVESSKVWQEMYNWLGVRTVTIQKAKDHFNVFTNLGRKQVTKFLISTWMATVWCIWKWRNDCKFNNLVWEREKIVSEIKSRLWSWRIAFGFGTKHSELSSRFLSTQLGED